MKLRLALLIFLFAGCGSSASSPPDAAPDAAPTPDAAIPIDASELTTFSYTPSWAGVTSVEVIGAFHQSTDWTTPLVTLTRSAGTFTGSAQLPPGQYTYLFHVIGDTDAGTDGPTFSRYALDPTRATAVACPDASPTFSTNMNPCSVADIPALPDAQVHVRGKVVEDGTPVAGYLVVLERDDATLHHFFVDRVTTTSDGSYDLHAAAGSYRIQVQHPQFESRTDAQLAPDTLGVIRRSISSTVPVTANVTFSDTEVAFHDYARFAPLTSATTPPTKFTFGANTSPAARLEIYGTGRAGVSPEIGDPWFAGAETTTGSSMFDGTFHSTKTTETAVAPGERYFWGVERRLAPDAAGLVWTAQSMVFPVTWN
ncbi:MAG: carboxypeptidase regulatory-like domain-containing protein [Kofleriaceae bacterium]